MPDIRYHQRDRDIFYKGKRVCTCYGTHEDMNESESEGYNLATEICKHLNETADLLEFWDNIEEQRRKKCQLKNNAR